VCTCADEDCTSVVCSQVALAFERCDAPLTVCPVGAECVDGWRTKDSTPTLFSENCGE